MKLRGVMLILLGVAGGIFVYLFDIIAGKPENYIGPKSYFALGVCFVILIAGLRLLIKGFRARKDASGG